MWSSLMLHTGKNSSFQTPELNWYMLWASTVHAVLDCLWELFQETDNSRLQRRFKNSLLGRKLSRFSINEDILKKYFAVSQHRNCRKAGSELCYPPPLCLAPPSQQTTAPPSDAPQPPPLESPSPPSSAFMRPLARQEPLEATRRGRMRGTAVAGGSKVSPLESPEGDVSMGYTLVLFSCFIQIVTIICWNNSSNLWTCY